MDKEMGDPISMYLNTTSFLVVLFAQMLSFLWRQFQEGISVVQISKSQLFLNPDVSNCLQ